MEWVSPRWPACDERRIIEKFILLPTWLMEEEKTVWLETATILQEYAGKGGWISLRRCDKPQDKTPTRGLFSRRWLLR